MTENTEDSLVVQGSIMQFIPSIIDQLKAGCEEFIFLYQAVRYYEFLDFNQIQYSKFNVQLVGLYPNPTLLV